MYNIYFIYSILFGFIFLLFKLKRRKKILWCFCCCQFNFEINCSAPVSSSPWTKHAILVNYTLFSFNVCCISSTLCLLQCMYEHNNFDIITLISWWNGNVHQHISCIVEFILHVSLSLNVCVSVSAYYAYNCPKCITTLSFSWVHFFSVIYSLTLIILRDALQCAANSNMNILYTF